MKKSFFITVLFILFISFIKMQAQPTIKQSFNGYSLTNKGTIRILVVFAQVDYSTTSCNQSSPIGVVSDWQAPSQACSNPLLCGAPTWAETWFDHEWNGSPSNPGNMTDYFYEASMHEYIVLGDYLSVVIPYSAFNGTLASAAIDYINQQISINNPQITDPYPSPKIKMTFI